MLEHNKFKQFFIVVFLISINKIKVSNKLNKYIKDIYVCVEDEKIITYKDFFNSISNNSELSQKLTKHISTQKIINCFVSH